MGISYFKGFFGNEIVSIHNRFYNSASAFKKAPKVSKIVQLSTPRILIIPYVYIAKLPW